jgi:hypothetical protein
VSSNSPVAKARVVPNFPGAQPLDAFEVGDISSQGLAVTIPMALATEQEVWVELNHPILQDPLQLPARVLWCRVSAQDPLPRAALEFAQLQPVHRMGLRMVQAAEVGCRIVNGERTVGFVVVNGRGQWSLYDDHTVKVANLSKKGRAFEINFYGERPEDSTLTLDANTLPEAVQTALDLSGPPLILPAETGQWFPLPLELPAATPTAEAPSASPARSPARAYHSVLCGGVHVGFLAITSIEDTWSLYDGQWNELATINPAQTSFKVTIISGRRGPEDSMEYFMARDFLGAIGLAFQLSDPIELDPPLSEVPESGTWDMVPEEDEEAPLPADRPHHCVIDEGSLIGYAAKSPGMRGSWSLYNSMREKLAQVVPDGPRLKVVFIGGNPDDSLEYIMARTLLGAIALAFELDVEPGIDPPLR